MTQLRSMSGLKDQSQKSGAQRLLSEYLELKAEDRLLIVAGPVPKGPTAFLGSQAIQSGALVRVRRKADGWKRVLQDWEWATVVLFLESAASTWSRTVLSQLAGDHKNPRVFRAFGFSDELLSSVFLVSRHDIQRLNASIISLGARSERAVVTSSAGTDIEISFSKEYGWIDAWGGFSGREPGVLPPGEVATYSQGVNGVLVAEGAINNNFGFPGDPRLEKRPVQVWFENSIVKEISCEDPVVSLMLRRFLSVPNAGQVGEVGFGTNTGLSEFVSFVSHINERFPALHIGLGAHNQGRGRVKWNCPFHLDLILKTCDIAFDGVPVMSRGRYVIDHSEGGVGHPAISLADTI